MFKEPITLTFYQWIICLLLTISIVSLIVGYISFNRGLAYRELVRVEVQKALELVEKDDLLWAYTNDMQVQKDFNNEIANGEDGFV